MGVETGGDSKVVRDSCSLWYQQLVETIGRIVAGGLLLLAAYYFVDRYRQAELHESRFAERRLEALARLWTDTDKHGREVLRTLMGETSSQDRRRGLRTLGASYYEALSGVGLFLSPTQISKLRSSVGDVYLDEKLTRLGSSAEQIRLEESQRFRTNWRAALNELRELGQRVKD